MSSAACNNCGFAAARRQSDNRWRLYVRAVMPHAKRKKPSAALRAIIAFNADYKCSFCHSKLPPGWHVDHITPLCCPTWEKRFPNANDATEAANAAENLQALCPNCHARKSLVEVSDPLLAAGALPARSGKAAIGARSALFRRSRARTCLPAKPAPGGTGRVNCIPWQAARIKQRRNIDGIWACSSRTDHLTEILTRDDYWTELVHARTERDYHKIHKKVCHAGRQLDYLTFRNRVNHLLSS